MRNVPEDPADRSRGRERNRLQVNQLRAVPIHLREREQFGQQADLAALGVIELYVERAGRVEARVAAVEVDATLGVKEAAVGVNGRRAAQRGVAVGPVQPRVRWPQ